MRLRVSQINSNSISEISYVYDYNIFSISNGDYMVYNDIDITNFSRGLQPKISYVMGKENIYENFCFNFSNIKLSKIFGIFSKVHALIILRQVISICNFSTKIYLMPIIYVVNPHNQGNNHTKLYHRTTRCAKVMNT